MDHLVTITLRESVGGAWLCHWHDSNGREAYVACPDQKAAQRWAEHNLPDGVKPSWLRPARHSRVLTFAVPV